MLAVCVHCSMWILYSPQVLLIVACITGVIVYRLAVYAAFASIMKDSPTKKIHLVGSLITPQLATSVTASFINFVIIMILNFFYERVAIWITDMGEEEKLAIMAIRSGGAGNAGRWNTDAISS